MADIHEELYLRLVEFLCMFVFLHHKTFAFVTLAIFEIKIDKTNKDDEIEQIGYPCHIPRSVDRNDEFLNFRLLPVL